MIQIYTYMHAYMRMYIHTYTHTQLAKYRAFFVRNFSILHSKFSDDLILVIYHKKLLSIQASFKRNFHSLVVIYKTKFFEKMFWSPGFLYSLFLLFLLKRSRKVPLCHDLLYDTAIIYIPHFNFPVHRTGAYHHKKSPGKYIFKVITTTMRLMMKESKDWEHCFITKTKHKKLPDLD